MRRWQHGFLQCIRTRGWNGLFKSKKLGFVVSLYFLSGILGTILMALALMFGGWVALPIIFGLHFIMTGLPVLYYGKKLGFKLPLLLRSWFDMFFLQYINLAIFFECVFKEFVLNRTVTNWVKGH